MKQIGVIGAGHVGLVTGACFAHLGHSVIIADNDRRKIEELKKLQLPFFEPGLEPLVKKAVSAHRLSFTTSISQLTAESEIIFIAVGTPSTSTGRADLSSVEQVTVEIASALRSLEQKERKKQYRVIVEKSTVPVLTGEWVQRTLALLAPEKENVDIAANPEFLREGNAIEDFFKPDRIVIGTENMRAEKIFRELYAPLSAPMIFTDIKSAELIKHASNSFLALKISYINAVSQICERVGADVTKVAKGMGLDHRIGGAFLEAGAGYGGSCFSKDIKAFIALAEEVHYPFTLLKEVEAINRRQQETILHKAREMLWNLKGKRIGILGLSFKPNTDDIRESPAIFLLQSLHQEGAALQCYDPKAMNNMKRLLSFPKYCKDPYTAARNAHLLILLTEWQEFKKIDFVEIKKSMKTPRIIDGRNFFNPCDLRNLGFIYKGIGR
ncbi:MAG: UDP-glucose/GDP-mannose dehydrogenase family protein [Candidatus Ratteibacteria bacterium]